MLLSIENEKINVTISKNGNSVKDALEAIICQAESVLHVLKFIKEHENVEEQQSLK